MQRLVKYCLLATIACTTISQSEAQTSTPKDTTKTVASVTKPPIRPKRPKALRKEYSFGLRLNTNGWGIFLDKGYVKSEDRLPDLFYDIRLFQLEFSEVKHTKEIKRANNTLNGTSDQVKPMVYGKINTFHTLKLGYGFRKMIAGKPEPGNVSIHWVYMGGLSLGLMKPYYVNALVMRNGVQTEMAIKYTDSTKAEFLDKQFLIGSAGFTEGLGEIQIVPGIHAKTGLHFDIASDKRAKLAIETGFGFEYYTKEVALMALQEASPYLVNFYASIQFGKRK